MDASKILHEFYANLSKLIRIQFPLKALSNFRSYISRCNKISSLKNPEN